MFEVVFTTQMCDLNPKNYKYNDFEAKKHCKHAQCFLNFPTYEVLWTQIPLSLKLIYEFYVFS